MNWIKLREAADGRVLCSAGNKPFVPVGVRPCFPLSGGGEQVALIGEDGGEVATLESPKGLDLESRKALEGAIRSSGFMIDVTAVHSVNDDGELLLWEIETGQGSRKFQTVAGGEPLLLGDGGNLVEDVSGDLYRIPPLGSLDPQSRRNLRGVLE